MGPQFYQAGYGKRFFEAQLPGLVRAISRLADAVEKENELKEGEKNARSMD